MEQQPREYKIVIYGAGGVGKNCLKYRLITGDFIPGYDPYWGEDWLRYDVEVDGGTEKIQVRRVNADSEENSIEIKNITVEYLKSADGFILAYSLHNRKTFEALPEFKKEIALIRDTLEFPLVIIETKVDLGEDVREVLKKEAEELAAKWNGSFLATSAKEGVNVIESFKQIVREIKKFNSMANKKDKKDKKKKVKKEKS